MTDVKLIGARGSPFSNRVEIALKIKGIEFEFVEEDLSNKSPLLLKYNPVHKKIPVLLHNGKPIAESLIILEYLDESFPGTPILPKDPYEKALARFWAKFIDEKCNLALVKAVFTKGEEQEKAKEEVFEFLKILDNELKNKKFFGGETVGLADIAGNFIAFWAGVLEEAVAVELVTIEKFPNLSRWRDDFINCDEIKGNLPDKDKLLAVFMSGFLPIALVQASNK